MKTVKELIDILKQYPDDSRIFMKAYGTGDDGYRYEEEYNLEVGIVIYKAISYGGEEFIFIYFDDIEKIYPSNDAERIYPRREG